MRAWGASTRLMTKLSKMLRARADAWAAARSDGQRAPSDLHESLPSPWGGPSDGRQAQPSALRPAPFEDIYFPKVEMEPLLQQVTLIVYGWHNVQPGTLSWVFPSVRMAVNAELDVLDALLLKIEAPRK